MTHSSSQIWTHILRSGGFALKGGSAQYSSQPECWLFQSGEKETTSWRGENLGILLTLLTKTLGGEFKIVTFEFIGKISVRHPGK